MRRGPSCALLLLAGHASACGGASSQRVDGAAPQVVVASLGVALKTGDASERVSPSPSAPRADAAVSDAAAPRILPVPRHEEPPLLTTTQGRHYVLRQTRVLVGHDGRIEAAADRLPRGRVDALALPAHLGGGFAFLVTAARGSELYRASTWLAALEPVASIGSLPDTEEPIVVGLDRLYLRPRTATELVGVDVTTKRLAGLGPLPPATSYGAFVAHDAWTAAVQLDLLGVWATFDAGSTWSPVRVPGRTPELLVEPSELGRGFVVRSSEGLYRLRVDGRVEPMAESSEGSQPSAAPSPAKERPPLERALLRGVALDTNEAAYVDAGQLVRVALDDGRVLSRARAALVDPDTSCQGLRVAPVAPQAPRAGFVCGNPAGKTEILAIDADRRLRRVLAFHEPRAVIDAPNGALVVHGPCAARTVSPEADVRMVCLRDVEGRTRELRLRGASSATRLVPLRDGAVAVVVPPTLDTPGELTMLDGDRASRVPLRWRLDGAPSDAPPPAVRGMWLDGMFELEDGSIGGWVELGNTVRGVRVQRDGSATAGEPSASDGTTLVHGPRALAVDNQGVFTESVDLGAHWQTLDVAPREVRAGARPSRDRSGRCSELGCSLDGILRIGWSRGAVEAAAAPEVKPTPPKLADLALKSAPLAFACSSPAPSAPPAHASSPARPAATNPLTDFFGLPAPTTRPGESAIERVLHFESVPSHVYVRGPKDAEGSRSGQLTIRFLDELAAQPQRSSAPTSSPWPDLQSASDAIGLGSYGYSVSWATFRDVGGSALLGPCRARVCTLFSVVPDEPATLLRSADVVGLPRPVGSAVRLGSGWYFLAEVATGDALALYRATSSTVEQVAELPRLRRPRFSTSSTPRLVRRAKGDALGLMFRHVEGPLDRRGTRWVVPLDPATGQALPAVRLGNSDLSDVRVQAGCDDRDGWWIEERFEPAPDARIAGSVWRLGRVDAKLRLDPGVACVEVASTVPDAPLPEARGEAPTGPTFPLFVTNRAAKARSVARCALAPRR